MNNNVLITLLDQKIALLEKAIAEAKKARDSAPSAMESHSDTTRSEQENLVLALTKSLSELQTLYKHPLSASHYYELTSPSSLLKFMIVPEGLGGQKIDNIFLISAQSPFATQLLSKKSGDTISFNGTSFIISPLLNSGEGTKG